MRGLSDVSGTLAGTADYDVFGAPRQVAGVLSSFGFAGAPTDAETGFSFLQARYPDPALGRFPSPDSVIPNAPGTQGYNPYAYAANNPMTWGDPYGHDLDRPAWVIALTFACLQTPWCAPRLGEFLDGMSEELNMSRGFGSLAWVESNGGPLLLLPEHLLPYWGGEAGLGAPPRGDYGRACSVEEYADLIPVGDGVGLVLGDMPMPTTWLTDYGPEGASGLLVRWMAAEAEASVLAALARLPSDVWEAESLHMHIGSEPLYLFDSAVAGSNAERGGALIFAIPAGVYRIRTGVWEADPDTSLVLHSFERGRLL